MLIDNSDRKAPAAFNDDETLEVSRRIMREQGSTFRVNGREVRARDVTVLFADASTGSRSPALVHQGRIGEIIQARPDQRRRVLEEAAGISGLHARRHEAELRLKAAEHNLARVEDVIGQLAAQVASLKTQARQAVRYRNISGQVRRTEALLFHLRWIAAQGRSRRGRARQGRSRPRGRRAHRRAGRSHHAAGGGRRRPAGAARGRSQGRRGAAAPHRRARDARARRSARQGAHRANSIAGSSNSPPTCERERKLAADAAAALERLDAEETALKAEAQAKRRAADRRQRARRAGRRGARGLGKILCRIDRRARRSDRAAQPAAGRRARARAARRAAGSRARQYRRRPCRDRQRRSPISPRSPPRSPPRKRALAEAENAARGRRSSRTPHAREKLDAARAPLAAAEQQRAAAGNRSQDHRQAACGREQKSLAAGDGRAQRRRRLRKGAGRRARRRSRCAGRSDPRRCAGPARRSMPSDPALPDGVAAAVAISCRRRRNWRAGWRRSASSNAPTGRGLRQLLKPGQRLVSREGDFWRWDGFAAAAHAPTGAARRLAERGRLAGDRRRARDRPRRCRSKAARASRAAEAALAAAAAAETKARDRWREAQHADRCRARGARRRRARDQPQCGAHFGAQGSQAAHQRRPRRSDRRAPKRRAGARRAAAGRRPRSQARRGQRRRSASDRAALAEVRVEAQAIAREAELADRRLQAIAAERAGWNERKDSAAAQIATIGQRTEEAKSRARPSSTTRRQKFAAQRAGADRRDRDRDARRAAPPPTGWREAETALAEADKAARAALEAVGEARAEAARAEERRDGAKRRLADIEHEIRELLEVEPAGAAELAELKAGEATAGDRRSRRQARPHPPRARAARRGQSAAPSRSCTRSRRSTPSSPPSATIWSKRSGGCARASTASTSEARERLLASFATVNENFKKLFTELFGGGNAELQLIESDDPLEAGLEIMAKPPGKKPATLSLLSGGEQALTALALIFAVFLTNPAPICVLDEVDAPLDDYNVERFCDLLDEMTRSTDTRFVIITHNPITMARMNRLYGVTMAERGVSQLVSVDLRRRGEAARGELGATAAGESSHRLDHAAH